MFVSVTPSKNDVIDGVHFFNDITFRLKLHRGMFTEQRLVLRAKFDPYLATDKIMRLDFGSYFGKKRITINKNVMC